VTPFLVAISGLPTVPTFPGHRPEFNGRTRHPGNTLRDPEIRGIKIPEFRFKKKKKFFLHSFPPTFYVSQPITCFLFFIFYFLFCLVFNCVPEMSLKFRFMVMRP
jgi:hypothetical protein